MSRERLIWIGLAAVLMLALIVAAVNGAQQNAWMEGYTFGRLAASAGEGAAVAPILPYGMGYVQRGPGFGGILFMLLGLGAVGVSTLLGHLPGLLRRGATSRPGPRAPRRRRGPAQPVPRARRPRVPAVPRAFAATTSRSTG